MRWVKRGRRSARQSRLPPSVVRRRTSWSAVTCDSRAARRGATTGMSRPGSCLELAAELAGSLAGPPDLSSNPRLLRSYGR